ncbi:MAG: hypothetical protein JW940_24780 [Polyangiaceae bacterium]|nr:hypothetical protein [Polyangiaceae bacterium]
MTLVSGLRSRRDVMEAPASNKRVLVSLRPGKVVTGWAAFGGGCHVAHFATVYNDVLLAVTGVRCGVAPYTLHRVESAAECVSRAGSFFYEPDQIFDPSLPAWDRDGLVWDGETIWDLTPVLHLHLPGGASPVATTIVAELELLMSARGTVVPDLGPEKLVNPSFDIWAYGAPEGWLIEADGGAAVSAHMDSAVVADGARSMRCESQGGVPAAWDDVDAWDGSLAWDVSPNPSIVVRQSVGLVPGARYRASGSYRNEGGLLPYVRVGGTWEPLAPSHGEW